MDRARRKAYKEVKQLMMEAPVPRCQTSPREVAVNASLNGIGGVLSQWIMYFSENLKQRSSTYDRILSCCTVLYYRCNYLIYKEFVLHSEHEGLNYINSQKKLNYWHGKWGFFFLDE